MLFRSVGIYSGLFARDVRGLVAGFVLGTYNVAVAALGFLSAAAFRAGYDWKVLLWIGVVPVALSLFAPLFIPDDRKLIPMDGIADGQTVAKAKLPIADLSRAKLIGTNFEGADLTNATLIGADCSGATFSKAQLANADCTGADMDGTQFLGAILTQAKFPEADCSGAQFDGADVTGANFSNADLAGADFTGARQANTDFTGADLTDTRGLG